MKVSRTVRSGGKSVLTVLTAVGLKAVDYLLLSLIVSETPLSAAVALSSEPYSFVTFDISTIFYSFMLKLESL